MIDTLFEQISSQSIWEVFAVVFAIAYLALAIRQNSWCWPFALLSTGIYSWLFWEVSLPFQVGLNVYYLMMAVVGWWSWRSIKQQGQEQIRRYSLVFHVGAILTLGVVAYLLAISFEQWFNSQLLLLDAVVTVFSVFTTYLVTQKVIENWLYWVVIDLASAYLFFQSELYLTCVLFLAYTVMAIYGFLTWSKQKH